MKRQVLLIFALLLLASAVHADFTFVQVSDTHVGVKEAGYNARYGEVIRQVNELKPAFVIHTGDALTIWSPENAALFKEISRGLAVPMYIAPGNHDLPDMKKAGPDQAAKTIADWKQVFEYDRVSFSHEGCVFIGPDSNLLSTGLLAEKEQIEWLKSELRKARGKRIFIFQHCPLFLEKPTDPNGSYFAVDEPARGSLLKLFKTYHVEAVLTGHVHRSIESVFDRISFISTPAISFSCDADKGLTGYSVFHVSTGGFTRRFVDLRKAGAPPDFQP